MAHPIQGKQHYIPSILFFLIAGFIFICHNSSAQVQDTTKATKDSITANAEQIDIGDTVAVKPHSPSKAALFSAVLPGLGQVYNKKYWKVPIIYALAAGAGTLIYYNATVYKNLNTAFKYRKDKDPATQLDGFSVWTVTGTLNVNVAQFSDEDLLTLREGYRRDLDLSVIFAAAVYGLNILDAVVDAHLFNFDVSDKLTMNVQPQFYPGNAYAKTGAGISLNLKF